MKVRSLWIVLLTAIFFFAAQAHGLAMNNVKTSNQSATEVVIESITINVSVDACALSTAADCSMVYSSCTVACNALPPLTGPCITSLEAQRSLTADHYDQALTDTLPTRPYHPPKHS